MLYLFCNNIKYMFSLKGRCIFILDKKSFKVVFILEDGGYLGKYNRNMNMY